MQQRLYCIYDFKAEAPVNKIFQAFSTDAEASRMFASVVVAPGTLIHEHPGDFGLLFVGVVNFDTLQIELNQSARFVPIAMGDAVVREIERARAVVSQNGVSSDIARDSIPGVADPRQLSMVSQ